MCTCPVQRSDLIFPCEDESGPERHRVMTDGLMTSKRGERCKGEWRAGAEVDGRMLHR